MNKKPIKNIGIFIIVAVASGWLGLLIDKSLEQQTDGDSLGMGVWLILPLLTTIILRLFAGDGWKDIGLKLNLIIIFLLSDKLIITHTMLYNL